MNIPGAATIAFQKMNGDECKILMFISRRAVSLSDLLALPAAGQK